MRHIQIADPDIGPEKQDCLEAVLENGRLADGSTVSEVQSTFGAVCDTESAVGTSNGSALGTTAVENGERHRTEVTGFFEAVQTDRKPIVAAEDGIRTLDVVERIQSVATDE